MTATATLFNPYTLSAYLNSVSIGNLFVFDPVTGQSSYTPSTRLPEGLNTFTAQAFDTSGAAISNYLSVSFTLDTVAPQFISVLPASGSAFNTPQATISGSINDATATIVLDGLAGPVTGPNFSFPVTLALGTNNYHLSAIDPTGNTAGADLSLIYSVVNILPTVSITAPANNANYAGPANITISATATDSDGTISKVDFYQGVSLIGTDTTAPYSIDWNGVATGSYSLTAIATDNSSGATTSSAIAITVTAPNVLPTVSLTAPTAGATYYLPATITLTASASDSDGTISQVEFYQGTTLIGTATASPYTIAWSATAGGTYSFTAKAIDNQGGSATSSAISVTVKDTIVYLHNDIAGNPIAATDSSGTILWKENFRPFGERLNNEAASVNNRQWFHRKAADADTGLSYFGARYYDPVIGRFMGVDAVGVQEGNLHSFNRYGYGYGNPFRYIDLDGNEPVATTYENVKQSISGWWNSSVAGFQSETPGSAAMRTLEGWPAGGVAVGVAAGITKNSGKIADALGDVWKAAKGAASERRLWTISREGAERVVSHDKFGNIFKSKSDGLWWAKDTAGHGGSEWKVFRESSKGLEWYRDADKYGDFIVGKHKGDVGSFIPWKDVAGNGF